ncbi:MAG: hypothetical protein Q8R78_04285 [Candidatus Omnitrophota bacterium]|nr:hypothetical protein [Candidatus Omnitrophota bacterium]
MNASERTIVLIPSNADTASSQYWLNFCHRVKQAIVKDGLEARIVVVPPDGREDA